MKKTGDGRRVQRMERELQQSIATYLVSGFKTPLPGLVTVARVQMPGDLRTAKVYVSILGAEDARDEVLERLKDRAFEIQDYLGRNLKSRFCPKLSFYLDDATENVLKIERILYNLEAERSAQAKTSPSLNLVDAETENDGSDDTKE